MAHQYMYQIEAWHKGCQNHPLTEECDEIVRGIDNDVYDYCEKCDWEPIVNFMWRIMDADVGITMPTQKLFFMSEKNMHDIKCGMCRGYLYGMVRQISEELVVCTGEQPMTFKEWIKKLAEPKRWYEIVAVFDCHV
uniref:hypothetical protein n=1 Tax=Eshraghiella crossota TaxID=45851 RepID=UPI0040266D4C